MSNGIRPVITRFRGYQLGAAGSSFSYFANGIFTLIEARATDLFVQHIWPELRFWEL